MDSRAEAGSAARCVFSVDVEDWYHILDAPGAPPPAEWDRMPPRVERNFGRLLGLLEAANVRATCFFLGWIAERFPHLVRAAQAGGHEVAAHGYEHRLVYTLTEEAFRADAVRVRDLLEDLTGQRVCGYRASGFSVTARTPWFFEALAGAGYRYDSSLFPMRRGHGGWAGQEPAPHDIRTPRGTIREFPLTVRTILGRRFCFFGGGYLRLSPYAVIAGQARRVLRDGRPVIFYLHPREIDPDQPRLPMSPRRRFQSYVNLRTTERKLERLLAAFRFVTLGELAAGDRPCGGP